jgi:predicted double-glycine peptidase
MLATISPKPVFPSIVKKCRNENMRDYNFACGSVWVQNLVSYINGETD